MKVFLADNEGPSQKEIDHAKQVLAEADEWKKTTKEQALLLCDCGAANELFKWKVFKHLRDGFNDWEFSHFEYQCPSCAILSWTPDKYRDLGYFTEYTEVYNHRTL